MCGECSTTRQKSEGVEKSLEKISVNMETFKKEVRGDIRSLLWKVAIMMGGITTIAFLLGLFGDSLVGLQ